jgi:hypothetical protein
MAHYTGIVDAGAALLGLLREHMCPEPVESQEHIDLCHPADATDISLGVYLYDIQENGENRQTDMISAGLTHLRFPPLSLNLHYLLTAYVSPHILMPRAMQVLYDHAVLNLFPEETLYIHLLNISAKEKLRLWHFPNIPYRLSMCYSLGPVFLESARLVQTPRVLSSEFFIKEL